MAMRTHLDKDFRNLNAPPVPYRSNMQHRQLLQSSPTLHLSSFFILPLLTIILIKFLCFWLLIRFSCITSESGKIDSTFIQQSF